MRKSYKNKSKCRLSWEDRAMLVKMNKASCGAETPWPKKPHHKINNKIIIIKSNWKLYSIAINTASIAFPSFFSEDDKAENNLQL